MALKLGTCPANFAACNRSSPSYVPRAQPQQAHRLQTVGPLICFWEMRLPCAGRSPKPGHALSNLLVIAAAGPVRRGIVSRALNNSNSSLPGGHLQFAGVMPAGEELAALKLPSLACSFPAMVHPEYTQVKAHCDEWIEMVAQLPSLDEARHLKECLLPLLVCRFAPRATSRRRLVQTIKLIAWLMVADDDDDHPGMWGCDHAYSKLRADCIMAILAQHPGDRMTKGHLLHGWKNRLSSRCLHRLTALMELWQEIRTEMSPLLRSRFVASIADYLEGLTAQAIMRKEGHIPDEDSYMLIRRKASFTIPCFILVEYSSSIALDTNTLQNPHIMELFHKATDYISLWNDIMSCSKEVIVGDYFNLPSILYLGSMGTRDKHTSFQSAIDLVSHLVKHIEGECNSIISSLKNEYSESFVDPQQASHVENFVEAMALAMSGALIWFFETPRYAIAKQLIHP